MQVELRQTPCCDGYWARNYPVFGSPPIELRYNPNNNGVAYQCLHCGSPATGWIKHSELPDVNVLALPRWAERTIPGQASLPF